MALIGYKEGRAEDYQCAGSLVAEQWILSAAHCSSSSEGPAKFAKIGNVVRYQETANSWTFKITQRVPHPNYSSLRAEDDIALFKLETTATLNKYVVPICLPQTEAQTTQKVIATGWGRTGFAENVSASLMKVTLEYFSRGVCDYQYEDDDKLDGKGINWSKMVCAGSNNKTGDTCNVSDVQYMEVN